MAKDVGWVHKRKPIFKIEAQATFKKAGLLNGFKIEVGSRMVEYLINLQLQIERFAIGLKKLAPVSKIVDLVQ